MSTHSAAHCTLAAKFGKQFPNSSALSTSNRLYQHSAVPAIYSRAFACGNTIAMGIQLGFAVDEAFCLFLCCAHFVHTPQVTKLSGGRVNKYLTPLLGCWPHRRISMQLPGSGRSVGLCLRPSAASSAAATAQPLQTQNQSACHLHKVPVGAVLCCVLFSHCTMLCWASRLLCCAVICCDETSCKAASQTNN